MDGFWFQLCAYIYFLISLQRTPSCEEKILIKTSPSPNLYESWTLQPKHRILQTTENDFTER